MANKTIINLLMLSVNIFALTLYAAPVNWQLFLLLFVLVFTQLKMSDIRLEMQLVACISILAIYLPKYWLQQTFAIIGLGLAINIAYHLDSEYSPSFINGALALGVIFFKIFKKVHQSESLSQQHDLTQKVLLLIFILPNLYLSERVKPSQYPRILFVLNPIIDGSWIYAIGFFLGIMMTENMKVPKYIKMLLISLCLLIQIFVTESAVLVVLTLLRGLLIFSRQQDFAQKVFLYLYLVIKCFLAKFLIPYMFIGYLIVSVILWQKKNQQKSQKTQNKKLQHIQLQIKAKLLQKN